MSRRSNQSITSTFWWVKHIIFGFGILLVLGGAGLTIFYLVDIGFIFHGAILNNGVITVGDQMHILYLERIGIPIAIMWVLVGAVIMVIAFTVWWRHL